METVTSKDGTRIAYDRLGEGPPVILVCGGSVDRMSNAGLAQALAADFTVFNYDRRGRGASGDTQPYAVAREVEDIAAVAAAAGGAACLYGTSSGAALAMEAAAARPDLVTRLAIWEAPYIEDGSRPLPPPDTAATFERLVAEGRRGDAAEHFMAKVVGMPPEFVAFARAQPWWAQQEAIAHTLAYDAHVMGDYRVPVARAAAVRAPTLVLAGSASFPFLPHTARVLAETIPGARLQILEGQSHDVQPAAIAPALAAFFKPNI